MESQWKPGDGRPPWARPNHPKSKSFDENNFNNSPFVLAILIPPI